MTDTATRVKIRFATKEFVATLDGGRITVTNSGVRVIDEPSPQAGKAIIAAICELENLQLELLKASFTRTPPMIEAQRLFGADELPLSVDIEGGKYTYGCSQAGAFAVVNQHLNRHGKSWIDTDTLRYKPFWFALAGALHNARRKLALLENTKVAC